MHRKKGRAISDAKTYSKGQAKVDGVVDKSMVDQEKQRLRKHLRQICKLKERSDW